ncbi:MAG: dynamin family protein, partial [Trebonia sp.]
MSGLISYRDHRLELGDLLRASLHLARSCADTDAESQARNLLSRLAADRFRLAVVGQFSRGKSTLMNALLGDAYLPMGALPMTSVITTVRYGTRPKAMIRRHQSALPVEVPLARVADFVAASSVRRAEMRVATVEVEVPAEILRLGFEFVDTPGVGSAVTASTAVTMRFLPQADAAIFVTGFDSPLTEAEAGLLADASRQAARLFLVLNKRDLVGDRDAAGAQDFVRRRLRDDLGIAEPWIYGLSALEALASVTRGDPARLSASGLPSLRADLEKFLTTDKTRLFLGNVAGRAAGLVSAQQRNLRLGQVARGEVPGILAAFDTRIRDLAGQQRAVVARVAEKVETSLPGLLAERSATWQAELQGLLDPLMSDIVSADAGDGPARTLLEAGQARLEQAGRDVTSLWLHRKTGEVHELITRVAAGEIGVMLGTSRQPPAIGARLAGLAATGAEHEAAGWSAEDIPELTVRMPEWVVPLALPKRLPRKASGGDQQITRYLAEGLAAAITAFGERARARFRESARDWAARLGDEASRRLEDAAEWFRHCLRTPPNQEDLAALDDLVTRLDELRTALAAHATPAAAGAADPGPASDTSRQTGRGQCGVCMRLEEALTAQLRRGQFLLATREADQARHTQAGGYCPL